MWTDLDRRWMDTKGPIQIVHDIETGYGDPLRVKATPDFSLRFLDDTYQQENKLIADIQGHMVEYFKSRGTKIATAGLTALQVSYHQCQCLCQCQCHCCVCSCL